MPYVALLGAGFIGGLLAGDGIDGTSRLVKWGVIGFAGYHTAKHFKVI